MTIAFIPARGGSKRIKNKNIKDFAGSPLIGHSIKSAIEAQIFDSIIVSTDSDEVMEIASKYGATPVKRDAALGNDYVGVEEVLLDFLNSNGSHLDDESGICCILPSNPFIKSHDLQTAQDLIRDWDYVFTVTESTKPLERALVRSESGETKLQDMKFIDSRTQDLSSSYFDAGQFYFATLSTWRSRRRILNSNSYSIELDKYATVDIDNPEDWDFAEYLWRYKNEKLRIE